MKRFSKWYYLDEHLDGLSRHQCNVSLWVNVVFFPLGLVKLFEIAILLIQKI